MKVSAKVLLLCIGGSITLLLIYALFWPVPIDPASWNPPEPPSLEGIYQQNHRLASVHRLGAGAGVGPEDVALDATGRIHAGMEDGRVLRFQPDGTSFEVFADTGGRPLGLRFDSGWNLVVADAYRGLLSVSPGGRVTVLSTEEGGVPFRLTDDVDIAEDGTIYFTDASFRFSDEEFLLDFLEHRPNGRLLAYEPETQITRLVLDRLYFANGVAVSPNQSFVLVVESSMARVKRYWLGTARKGESDIFIENLPGYPDGISSNGKTRSGWHFRACATRLWKDCSRIHSSGKYFCASPICSGRQCHATVSCSDWMLKAGWYTTCKIPRPSRTTSSPTSTSTEECSI